MKTEKYSLDGLNFGKTLAMDNLILNVNLNGGKNKNMKKPFFGGCFCNKYGERVYIKEIIYNDPAVIVFWSDNTKTISKRDERDTWDTEKGVVLCVLKKVMGGEFVANLLKDWGEPSPGRKRKTLTEVRKETKLNK